MRRGLPHTAKSSDQMPEEAPAEQVPDDVPEKPEGAARESARRHIEDARTRRARQRRGQPAEEEVSKGARQPD
jgi:hypothetical protein